MLILIIYFFVFFKGNFGCVYKVFLKRFGENFEIVVVVKIIISEFKSSFRRKYIVKMIDNNVFKYLDIWLFLLFLELKKLF